MMEYVTCLKMRGIDVRATKHWDQNSERMELADLKGVCMLVLETFNLGIIQKDWILMDSLSHPVWLLLEIAMFSLYSGASTHRL